MQRRLIFSLCENHIYWHCPTIPWYEYASTLIITSTVHVLLNGSCIVTPMQSIMNHNLKGTYHLEHGEFTQLYGLVTLFLRDVDILPGKSY